MKTATLTVAAFLLSGGTVLAASDHYGSQESQRPATMFDPIRTSSNQPGNARSLQTVQKPPATKDEYGRGIWGR